MRWLEILNESVKKYEPMFQAFRDDTGKLPSWVASRIRSVETLLGREDRIVWALRWERVFAAQKSGNSKLLQKALRDTKSDETSMARSLEEYETMMRDHFAHWFSLGANSIQSYVFDRQTPDQVWVDLSQAEEEWKKTRAQIINHEKAYPHIDPDEDEEDPDYDEDGHERDPDESRQMRIEKQANIEKIIDFGDGWAWWNLHRTYCTTEGSAMGHCGNGPSAKPGDEVLSLRRDLGNGNYRPSLTFILDENGMLVEMKGRANEKPAERYHGMIVALLKNPLIKGCVGGGYASGNNFTVLDLPEETRAPLLKMKPDLLTVYDRLSLYKNDPSEENQKSIVEAVHKSFRSQGFTTYNLQFDFDKDDLIVQEWKDRDHYMTSQGNYNMMRYLKDFFFDLEDKLMEHFCNDWTEAGLIAAEAEKKYSDNIFDELIHYANEDFLLDGMHYAIIDGKVQIRISIRAYLNPSSDHAAYDDDPTPVLDRMREITDTTGYDSPDWSDVSDSISGKLDEVATEIARYCFEQNSRCELDAVGEVYKALAPDEESNLHYYSNHPDQLSFDFPEKSA